MIVRDEADSLPRALRSCQGVVDEVVVVDTGSRDATLEIAHRFGAVTRCVEWADDFAAARNHSLALARGEWILVLDADEELTPEARQRLPLLLDTAAAEGYMVQIVSPTDSERLLGAEQSAALRLFRNRPGHRFEGALHEQVAPSILRTNPQAILAGSEIQILHHGYQDAVRRAKGKHERNLRILQRMLAADRWDGFVHCNLGVEAVAAGRHADAALLFQTAIDLAPAEAGWRSRAVKYGAIVLGELGRWPEAQALLAAELPRYPRYTDLYYLNGLTLHRLGQHEGAANAFRQCEALGPAPCPPYNSVSPDLGGPKACCALGLVLEEQGRLAEAAQAYMRALQGTGASREPLEHLARLLERAGGREALREQVGAFADAQSPAAAMTLAGLFARIQRFDVALRCAESAQVRGHEGADAAQLVALCHYQSGRYKEALRACKRAAGATEDAAAVMALRCACLLHTGDTRAARAVFRGTKPPDFFTQLALLLRDEPPEQLGTYLQLLPDLGSLRAALAAESHSM